MSEGAAKWFNEKEGHVLIQPGGGGRDALVHAITLQNSGPGGPGDKQQVSHDVVAGHGGRALAKLKPA